MIRRHSQGWWAASALLGGLLLLGGCSPDREGLLDEMLRLERENRDSAGPERVEALRQELRSLDQSLTELVSRVQRRGSLYRALGLELLQIQAFGEAAKAFGEALQVSPESGSLHYYRGLALANQAKREVEPGTQAGLYAQARRSYELALELNREFPDAVYAWGILVGLELNQPEAVLGRLSEEIQRLPDDNRLRFLRGRLLTALERWAEAAQDYRWLAQNARLNEDRQTARSLAEQTEALR